MNAAQQYAAQSSTPARPALLDRLNAIHNDLRELAGSATGFHARLDDAPHAPSTKETARQSGIEGLVEGIESCVAELQSHIGRAHGRFFG